MIAATFLGVLKASEVKDCHGSPVFELHFGTKHKDEVMAVLFVDTSPEANWAHPCRYVFVDQEGSDYNAEHDWPPENG